MIINTPVTTIVFTNIHNILGMRQMRNHLLASEGYCVVSIDSRGSHNRGTAFEAHLRHRMGQVSSSKQNSCGSAGRLLTNFACLIFILILGRVGGSS